MYLKLQKLAQGGRIYQNHIQLACNGIKDARTIQKYVDWLLKHDLLQEGINHFKITPQYVLCYGKTFVSFDQDILDNLKINQSGKAKALCFEIATEIKERQKLSRAKGYSIIERKGERTNVRGDESILQNHNFSACGYMAQCLDSSKGEVCKMRKCQWLSRYETYVFHVAKAKNGFDFLIFSQMMNELKEFNGFKGGFYVYNNSLYFKTTSFRVSCFKFGRR